MRMRTSEHLAVTMTALLTLTTMFPVHAQQPENPSPDAGFFGYAGGAAKAKRARTQTAPTTFAPLPAPAWVNLPGATLSFAVPATQTELFNVAFSSECQKLAGGPLLIRVLINGVPMEPYDGFQAFCSIPNPATHSGLWVRRVGPGNYTLQVQFFNTGGGPGIIDDWTFELVVYE
jgi:hypothetical protein